MTLGKTAARAANYRFDIGTATVENRAHMELANYPLLGHSPSRNSWNILDNMRHIDCFGSFAPDTDTWALGLATWDRMGNLDS